MSTTASGIPRVSAVRKHKAKPLEEIGKRPNVRKKKKEDTSDPDDIDNAWRSR